MLRNTNDIQASSDRSSDDDQSDGDQDKKVDENIDIDVEKDVDEICPKSSSPEPDVHHDVTSCVCTDGQEDGLTT